MILPVYCWIWFANIVLRIFASMFISDIGLWFSFFFFFCWYFCLVLVSGWSWLLSNYCFCPGSWSAWDCLYSIRVKSLFLTTLWVSWMKALLAFQVKCSGCSSSWHKTPGLGILMWCSDPSLLVIIFLFVGLGLDYNMTPPLLPVSLWFFLCIFSCRSFLVGSKLLHW